MTKQDFSVTKKRGRPQGRVKPPTSVLRLPDDLLEKIDAWIAAQPDPKPSRPEAVRTLVEAALPDELKLGETIPLEELNASNDE